MDTFNKKKYLKFSTEDDLSFLRQVVCYNPYNDSGQWSIIQKNVSQ